MIKIDITKELHSAYGDITLDINLHIKPTEFVSMIGESGSGKTTFLRALAGLEESYGTIEVDGEIWQDKNYKLPIQKRGLGFVFQNYALFSNMTVLQNLLFASKDKILADKLLSISKLTNLKDKYPHQLSGGQQQRVSLCRAMMNKPKLLLMDEPLSALDSNIKQSLQDDILTLHKEFNTTTIMVSHNLQEVYRLSDRMLVLDKGKISQDKYLQTTKNYIEAKILDIKDIDSLNSLVTLQFYDNIITTTIPKNKASVYKIDELVSIKSFNFDKIL